MGSQRDCDTDAGFDGDNFLLRTLFAPHFAAAGQREPDLFNRAMGDSGGCLAWRQLKMRHAAALEAK
jgi:hypothetical protein